MTHKREYVWLPAFPPGDSKLMGVKMRDDDLLILHLGFHEFILWTFHWI